MEITLFWTIVFTSALSLGFFLAVVLFGQYLKHQQASQLFLGAFVFIFSMILLNNFVYWNQAMRDYPHFIYSTVSIRFLLIPLFYCYCKTFLPQGVLKKDGLHFLPFLLLTVLFFPILILSGSEKIDLINDFRAGDYPSWAYYSQYLKWFLSLQLIAYPCLIYYKLSNYLKKQGSSMDKNKLTQINCLYFFNSLVLLYGLLMFFYYVLVAWNVGGIEKDFYISFVMCVAIYCVAYIGMDQPDLLKGEKFLHRIQQLKYTKTNLEQGYLKQTITQLEALMQSDQTFLESDIKLRDIAQKINVPHHHISQALNQYLGKTFHEFINQYRVNYACRLMQESTETSNLKTIMYESGFNNRASFNNNFKKIKGMTASQYLSEELKVENKTK